MWHENTHWAVAMEKWLQDWVSFTGHVHENASAECGGVWNNSLTSRNYCT